MTKKFFRKMMSQRVKTLPSPRLAQFRVSKDLTMDSEAHLCLFLPNRFLHRLALRYLVEQGGKKKKPGGGGSHLESYLTKASPIAVEENGFMFLTPVRTPGAANLTLIKSVLAKTLEVQSDKPRVFVLHKEVSKDSS